MTAPGRRRALAHALAPVPPPARRRALSPAPPPSAPYEKVWAVVATIPRGRVLSYGDVAMLAGYPRAARFAAGALRYTKPTRIPWHRVVGKGGEVRIAEPDLRAEQIRRLRAEGVDVDEDGRLDYARHAWAGPSGPPRARRRR